MASKMKTKRDFSAGGIVYDANHHHVLMIKVKNLMNKMVWTFPKGHPEPRETDEEAAIREVREETGWKCEIENPIMDVSYSYVYKKVKVNKIVRWFLMNPLEEVGTFNPDEIMECQWVDVNKAKSLITYDSDKKLLKRLVTLI